VDEKSRFREDNFQKAMAVLQGEGGEEESGKKKKNGGKGQQSELGKIVRLIMERSYDPVIIFSFSKRECEAYALKMSKLDFNEEGEKELVEQVRGGRGEWFWRCLRRRLSHSLHPSSV
jgi:ATP-dependent RNA helicase DOB1